MKHPLEKAYIDAFNLFMETLPTAKEAGPRYVEMKKSYAEWLAVKPKQSE